MPRAGAHSSRPTPSPTRLAASWHRLRRAIVAPRRPTIRELPDAVAALVSHIAVYRSDYPVLVGGAADRDRRNRRGAGRIWPSRWRSSPTALAHERRGGRAAAAAVRGGDGQVDGGLPVLPRRAAGVAQRGRRRARPFGVSAAEFHQRAAVRARLWPHAMTALTTHDTKRGEDVRARIGVLSQVPSLWAELVGEWAADAPHAGPGDRTVPVAEHLRRVAGRRRGHRRAARQRLHAYAEKAIREAAVHTIVERPGRRVRDSGARVARHRASTDRSPPR